MKFWPVMVSWIPGPEALFPSAGKVLVQLLFCEPVVTMQTDVTRGPPMVNFTGEEEAGPGFCTETLAEPAEAINDESMSAYNCVALTRMVGNCVPFQINCDPVWKLVPVTTNWNAGPPATAEAGLKVAMAGTRAVSVNVSRLLLEPPGLFTITSAVPALAICCAEICALICVELRNVVGAAAPFQVTVEPLTKFVPMTARENEGPPAFTAAGLRLTMVGAPTVNCAPLDCELVEFATFTKLLPGVVRSEEAMVAVSCAEVTKMVGMAVLFHCTVEAPTPFTPWLKLLAPLTAIWSALDPAAAELPPAPGGRRSPRRRRRRR